MTARGIATVAEGRASGERSADADAHAELGESQTVVEPDGSVMGPHVELGRQAAAGEACAYSARRASVGLIREARLAGM
jgi:hypothetical protein